jgi:hypothetical protein
MQRIITASLFVFIISQSFGQSPSKFSSYLMFSYKQTLQDQTLGNNPWSLGLGMEGCILNKSSFIPTLEITGDLYLEDDKVLRLDQEGKAIPSISGVINLFGGSLFKPTPWMFIGFSLGPSFMNGKAFLGIQPALGFFFPGNQRWLAKISYIDVLNRGTEDFKSLRLSLGFRLY